LISKKQDEYVITAATAPHLRKRLHWQVQPTRSLPNNSLGRYHIRQHQLEECKIVLWLPFQGPTVPAVQVHPQLDSDVAPTSYSRQQYWSTMLRMRMPQGRYRSCFLMPQWSKKWIP
jgi:hypothetical protein